MAEQLKFTVDVEDRADKVITKLLQEIQPVSRAYIQKLISSNCILVNEQILTNNKLKLHVDDIVDINLPDEEFYNITPVNLNLDIVYEDDYLVVVNKPNDLVVHPAPGNWEKTLVHGLMYQIKNLAPIGGVIRPGIVHRLDKQTEGLIIVAKTDETHQKLVQMFANSQITKRYYALVHGVIEENEGIIKAPIARHPGDRKKMTVSDVNGKHAITSFKVLQRFANATLITCNIETGRTHQIRVHMKFINHPVIGDNMYGYISDRSDKNGQCLQAYSLEFDHPITHERLAFKIELSSKINGKIKELEI